MKHNYLYAMTLAALGCSPDTPPSPPRYSVDTVAAENRPGVDAKTTESNWAEQVGKRVTLTGKVEHHKFSPFLKGDGSDIYVDFPGSDLPEEGEMVRVTGTVEMVGIPVANPDPMSRPVQGHPLPIQGFVVEDSPDAVAGEGGDPAKAPVTYMLKSVQWERIENSREPGDERVQMSP